MKRDNRGLTLVEVVVIIAMIGILAGTGVYGIAQISGFRAREGADTIANSITQARIAMLGKSKGAGNMAWEIRCDGSKYYVRTVYNVGTSEYYKDEEKIVNANVEVYIGETTKGTLTGAGTTTTQLLTDSSTPVRFYFNRSTGALCDENGVTNSSNAYISVKQGNKNYDVMIIAKTGKILTQTVRK